MKAEKGMTCKMCDREIKEGDQCEPFSSWGRYAIICQLCDRKLYQRYSDIIIKKIKE